MPLLDSRFEGTSFEACSHYASEVMEPERNEQIHERMQKGHEAFEESTGHQFAHTTIERTVTGNHEATPDPSNYENRRKASRRGGLQRDLSRWQDHEEDAENDVPASLLVEPNERMLQFPPELPRVCRDSSLRIPESGNRPRKASWGSKTARSRIYQDEERVASRREPPRSLMRGLITGGQREEQLWRWANITNLDSFMRDIYDYYEGGGLWCILCSNACWLLETLFVAILLTFLTQCVDYGKVSESKSLSQVVVKQCTRRMSFSWNIGIWLYTFFFIWKSIQYFFEIRRLTYVRNFFVHLLDIPEQDMQTVSWQDIVARIMNLRDENPQTATNIPRNLRRFIGSQSKERLDAHDIANRLMRKENFLIAMINKDILDLSLPIPFLRERQLFSKTMEWYLHYCILDMAFNELGQVRQDFLRADRRSVLSQKLRQRLYFAGFLNLIFAPVVLAYVMIVYFFTYYNEYQKDPKMAAARKYTALAEWKFREFNELPHIFYERLHMSFPFASRYIDQFPKRMTEEVARSIAFMSGAFTSVLAVCTILDSELFLGFEITKDRTVLFYLGIFGGIWAMTRGMVSEETTVFNPEYALRNVIEYTRYMPDHWRGRLHSFEVKREFSELYKMKVVIFLEEVLGIITTPLVLFFSLPKCAEQIIDFLREFTVHVDGLGYVCSFAVFDFKKGIGQTVQKGTQDDVREDYYSTKHGKMAASFYGFLDNYVINPKTGIPGHQPPGSRANFRPPPVFPSLNSPSLAADVHSPNIHQAEMQGKRVRPITSVLQRPSRSVAAAAIPQLSPMASSLLDSHHQPIVAPAEAMSSQRSRQPKCSSHGGGHMGDQSITHGAEERVPRPKDDIVDEGGMLDASAWETSPSKGLSRENSSTNPEEAQDGMLGLIYQFRQAQHGRRGGMV